MPPSAAWQYVAPTPGDPFEHPPWRAISLSPTKPADIVEKVAYQGRPRYAQLRYGSPGSTRVTVVVDEVGSGEVILYVDADRNRRIEARDLVNGRGRVWRLPLAMALAEEESTREIPREIVLRLGSTGRVLSIAAAGYLEGTVRMAGRDHAVRRTDGDADGSYTSPQDHLWVDLNDNGRWDPDAEQFLYAAILTIGPAPRRPLRPGGHAAGVRAAGGNRYRAGRWSGGRKRAGHLWRKFMLSSSAATAGRLT